jgi:hypothetical protein
VLDQYNQLPMLPAYRTEAAEFPTLSAAARSLPFVTARPEHRLVRRPGRWPRKQLDAAHASRILAGSFRRPTLFHEIDAVLKDSTVSVRQLLPLLSGRRKISAPQLARKAVSGLSEFLEQSWEPDMRHVVLHSSGYDTRIVCGVLRQLHQRLGDRWLGEVLFCSFAPEREYAKGLFDYFGWPEHTWHPVGAERCGTNYYAPILDFDCIGTQLSEPERFWDGALLTQVELERDFLTAPAQGLTGLWSDETSKWNRLRLGDVARYVGALLFDNPGVLPGRPDAAFMFPFASVQWVKLLTRYRIPVPVMEFKQEMLRQIDPELARPPKFPRTRNIAEQHITELRAVRMEREYRKSWYAHAVGPPTLHYQADPVVRFYDDRNVHYMKAAIYEHVRQTTEVRIGER